MSLKILGIALLGASLLLAGCNDKPESAGTAKAASQPVSTAAIAAEAKGFVVGNAMSTRTVYVFFDPQCPHCAALWEAAKPLRPQAKFVWIPVGIMNSASSAQGAALLGAADPEVAMEQHEASLQARQGGISAGTGSDALKAQVASNTALMTRFGFGSIPTIVSTHAQSGALVTQEGSMPTAALATLLGLRVPSPATP